MRKMILIFFCIPVVAWGYNDDTLSCLYALSERDFSKSKSPSVISPEPGFSWQWDGTAISLKKSPYRTLSQPEVVWTKPDSSKEDGRVPIKLTRDQIVKSKLPSAEIESLQKQFLKVSFVGLTNTKLTERNAIELDKIYAQCENVEKIKHHQISIGKYSQKKREEIRSQFPNIFSREDKVKNGTK